MSTSDYSIYSNSIYLNVQRFIINIDFDFEFESRYSLFCIQHSHCKSPHRSLIINFILCVYIYLYQIGYYGEWKFTSFPTSFTRSQICQCFHSIPRAWIVLNIVDWQLAMIPCDCMLSLRYVILYQFFVEESHRHNHWYFILNFTYS